MKPNELIARAWEHARDGFSTLARDPTGYDNAGTGRAVAREALHAVEDLIHALGQERGIIFPEQGSVGPPLQIRAARALALADAVREFLTHNDGRWTSGVEAVNALKAALTAFDSGAPDYSKARGLWPRARGLWPRARATGSARSHLVYTVKDGDTLPGIAERFDVQATYPFTSSVSQLASINRIEDTDHIQCGWKLIIP